MEWVGMHIPVGMIRLYGVTVTIARGYHYWQWRRARLSGQGIRAMAASGGSAEEGGALQQP